LVLLLHLLPALIVSLLLIRALALLCLLLLDTLTLLVLLLPHVLQLLLMLPFQLRIAVRWRIRRLSRWRPIVACVRLDVSWRPIGLRARRRRVGAIGGSWPVRLHARWRRVRPVILICWPRGGWPIHTLIVWPIRRTILLRAIWRLRIVRPFSVRPIVLLSIILLNVARLLHRTIHVLRRRGPIAVIPRRRGYLPRRRSHPHRSNCPSLLLLRLCFATL
jgi:hypothetical protein